MKDLHNYKGALQFIALALSRCTMKPGQELEIVRNAVSLALNTEGKSMSVCFKIFHLLDFVCMVECKLPLRFFECVQTNHFDL